MSNTKHDACADEVKLDFGELLKTARIAVVYSRDELNRSINRWYDIKEIDVSDVYADAMLRDAESLCTSTKTLHYLLLQNGRRYSIINAHEVAEE